MLLSRPTLVLEMKIFLSDKYVIFSLFENGARDVNYSFYLAFVDLKLVARDINRLRQGLQVRS